MNLRCFSSSCCFCCRCCCRNLDCGDDGGCCGIGGLMELRCCCCCCCSSSSCCCCRCCCRNLDCGDDGGCCGIGGLMELSILVLVLELAATGVAVVRFFVPKLVAEDWLGVTAVALTLLTLFRLLDSSTSTLRGDDELASSSLVVSAAVTIVSQRYTAADARGLIPMGFAQLILPLPLALALLLLLRRIGLEPVALLLLLLLLLLWLLTPAACL